MFNINVNVNNKVKIVIFLFCVVALFATVNTTYARYVSSSEGVVSTNLARWQIFINTKNVTESYGSSITFSPVIEPNKHVAANKIAPSSKGYFDIAIDPTNVDVSFTYDINFTIPEDSNLTDIKVTNYAIVEGTEITEETELTKVKLNSTTLSDKILYDETKPFAPFVIRVFFAWIDDETNNMDDQSDSNIGNMVATGELVNFELGVNINFKQYIEDDETEEPTQGDENIDNTAPIDPEENTDPDDITNPEEGNDPDEPDVVEPGEEDPNPEQSTE